MFTYLFLAAFSIASVGTMKNFELDSNPETAEQRIDFDSLPSFGFSRHIVTDNLGREVNYYLSNVGDNPVPLVLFIQGSGCNSLFGITPSGRVHGGLQNKILDKHSHDVCVMVVEKPGVCFGDHQEGRGIAVGCSDSFLFEHTVERWVEALQSALIDAVTRPVEETGIDSTRVLVMGHSEGSDMAAHLVASVNTNRPGTVTHTALLAGASVTQLFEMMQLAWRERVSGELLKDRQARVDNVLEIWRAIQADPDSTTEMAWGHPYRRWSSFMRNSAAHSLEQIAREQSDVKIFLAQGTDDASSPVESFDAALARLLIAGGTAEIRRIPGADHALSTKGQRPIDGLRSIMNDAVEWFLTDSP